MSNKYFMCILYYNFNNISTLFSKFFMYKKCTPQKTEYIIIVNTYFMPYGIERNGRPEIYAIGYKQIINHLKELVDMECIPILFVDACYAGDFYERSKE